MKKTEYPDPLERIDAFLAAGEIPGIRSRPFGREASEPPSLTVLCDTGSGPQIPVRICVEEKDPVPWLSFTGYVTAGLVPEYAARLLPRINYPGCPISFYVQEGALFGGYRFPLCGTEGCADSLCETVRIVLSSMKDVFGRLLPYIMKTVFYTPYCYENLEDTLYMYVRGKGSEQCAAEAEQTFSLFEDYRLDLSDEEIGSGLKYDILVSDAYQRQQSRTEEDIPF